MISAYKAHPSGEDRGLGQRHGKCQHDRRLRWWRAPGQRIYALLRPVVLFSQSPAERAAETGAVI